MHAAVFLDVLKLRRPGQSSSLRKCEAFCRHTDSVMSSAVETSLDISVSETVRDSSTALRMTTCRYSKSLSSLRTKDFANDRILLFTETETC
jgi:hypothetical protein